MRLSKTLSKCIDRKVLHDKTNKKQPAQTPRPCYRTSYRYTMATERMIKARFTAIIHKNAIETRYQTERTISALDINSITSPSLMDTTFWARRECPATASRAASVTMPTVVMIHRVAFVQSVVFIAQERHVACTTMSGHDEGRTKEPTTHIPTACNFITQSTTLTNVAASGPQLAAGEMIQSSLLPLGCAKEGQPALNYACMY